MPVQHGADLHAHLLRAGRGHASEPDIGIRIHSIHSGLNPGGFCGIGRDDSHPAAFDGCRPVRTGRPDTAAATIRISSVLPRIPAAPSRSICTDTPDIRDSGWHPGPDPKISRSSADQVAAGTPVWWAAITDRHRRPDRATPAAEAITTTTIGADREGQVDVIGHTRQVSPPANRYLPHKLFERNLPEGVVPAPTLPPFNDADSEVDTHTKVLTSRTCLHCSRAFSLINGNRRVCAACYSAGSGFESLMAHKTPGQRLWRLLAIRPSPG